jgi:hypothetical protein
MPKYTDTNNLIPLPLMHQILWPLASWTNGSQLGPVFKGLLTGVIYTRLFKYIQQHAANFTENSNDYICYGARTS